MVIVGVAAEYTMNINRNVQRSNDSLETAIAVGDSCIDLLFANWRTTLPVTPTRSHADVGFPTIALPAAANFPLFESFQSFSFGASATDYYGNNTVGILLRFPIFKIVSADAEWSPLWGLPHHQEPMFGLIDQEVKYSLAIRNTNPAILRLPLTLNYVAFGRYHVTDA